MSGPCLRTTAHPTACWAGSTALLHLHAGFSHQRCPRAQEQSLSLPRRSLPSPTPRHPKAKGGSRRHAATRDGLQPLLSHPCSGSCLTPSAHMMPLGLLQPQAPSDAHCDTHPRITDAGKASFCHSPAGIPSPRCCCRSGPDEKATRCPARPSFHPQLPLQKHLGRAHGLPFGEKRKNTVKRGCNLSVDGMNRQKQERVWLQKAPRSPPGWAGEMAVGPASACGSAAWDPARQEWSHLLQVFSDPPPPAKRLQSLERSQRSRRAPGPAPASPVSGAGSRPQPWQGDSACLLRADGCFQRLQMANHTGALPGPACTGPCLSHHRFLIA